MEKHAQREAKVYLEPKDEKGQEVFGFAFIDASLIDRSRVEVHMHVTDVTTRETIYHVNLKMQLEANGEPAYSYGTKKAALIVANECQQAGITALHVEVTGTEGDQARPGALALVRALQLQNIKVGRVENVPHIPSHSTMRSEFTPVFR